MEKAMAPHSSTLAWKIPWTEEPGGLQFMGSLRVRHDWATSLSLFTFMQWRRKWHPTHCSCLENPRDGGAWWAAIHVVAQSQIRLKQLSSSNSSSNPHNGPASLMFFSPFYRHLGWAPEDLRSFNKLKKLKKKKSELEPWSIQFQSQPSCH